MMIHSRRSLFVAAPAVIAAAHLMRVRAIKVSSKNWIYLPDFHGTTTQTMLDDAITIQWPRMLRMDSGDWNTLQIANVDSERYNDWLREDTRPRHWAPHIQFGGAKVSVPGGDPTFYRRWELNARAAFGPDAHGRA